MSIRVKMRLSALGLVTTHDERQDLDREIENKTGEYCDKGVDKLSDDDLIALLNIIRKRKKRNLTQEVIV